VLIIGESHQLTIGNQVGNDKRLAREMDR
jgi:hypothetical protein